MDRFKALGVPAEVINLLKKPPLLEGESSEEYLTLVLGLFEKHHVSNTPEFLLLKRYADCWWEIERLKECALSSSTIGRPKPRSPWLRITRPRFTKTSIKI